MEVTLRCFRIDLYYPCRECKVVPPRLDSAARTSRFPECSSPSGSRVGNGRTPLAFWVVSLRGLRLVCYRPNPGATGVMERSHLHYNGANYGLYQDTAVIYLRDQDLSSSGYP